MAVIETIANFFGVHPLSLIFWTMFGTASSIAVLWIGLAVQYQRRRRAVLSELASSHGWKFDHKMRRHAAAGVPRPYRKRAGISPRAENCITGDLDSFPIAVFDDSYSVSDGNGFPKRITQTIVALQTRSQGLPDVSVQPRGWLGGTKTKKTVELSAWPELTQNLAITSPDPTDAAQLFSPGLVELLSHQPRHTFQLQSGWLLLFVEKHRAQPDEIDRTIDRLLLTLENFDRAVFEAAA